MLKKSGLLTIIILFFVNVHYSQVIVNAIKISSPPQIDGLIDENEWAGANPVSTFTQLEPSNRQAATKNTSVFLAYDEFNIYVAFKCYQDNGIVANVQTRDKLKKSDDAVMLILDTYSDNRSAYCFIVNPIGTQTDFRITDDGRNKNYDWDGEWKSAAAQFAGGWNVEIAIPFKNIKYNSSLNSWGVNFGRIIRSNAETSWWSPDMNDDFRISQGGIMQGINSPARTDRFLITPYASLRHEDSDINDTHGGLKTATGADIRFNITPNLNLNATINPDFASIEGDRQRIDLSGWEISFPEKRLFFREGNEMFDMRYRLFYSRRIGDINYGGKFTGKIGDYSMNVMSVRSVENQEREEPAAFYSVVRVKKDIFKSSTLGFTFVDKSSDTASVRNYGFDWVLNPGEFWKITGQLIGSSPGDFWKHSGGFIRVAHESNKHHIHVRYSDLGISLKDNFNKTGFLSDGDRKEFDADVEYKFWLNNNTFKYIELATMNNAYWGQDGQFRSSKFRENARFYFENKFSIDFYYVWENRLVDSKYIVDNENDRRYKNHFLQTTLGYNTDESSYGAVKYTQGKNFGRNMQIWEGNSSLVLFKKLAITYSIVKLDFKPTENSDLTLRLENPGLLNILSLDYYFTNDLWIHIFAQSDSFKDRFYFYGKFGWRFKPPFGAVYLIYAGDDYYDHKELIQMQSNTVFLKLTYPIGF
jgi:hypothetical protein